MKGVILAGGTGSRLFPLTKVTNKHLLPVFNKPMIYYPLETLKSAGIDNILIVSGKEHAEHFIKLFGSGAEYGIKLLYAVQDKAGGIAEALSLAGDFAGKESIAVVLGDNIFDGCEEQLSRAVENFPGSSFAVKLFFKEREDAHRFGVATLAGDRLVKITEKPKNPESKFAQVGFYLCKPVIFEQIKNLKPSLRGELEITDLNNIFVNQGLADYEILQGEWIDAGTMESLHRAHGYFAKKHTSTDLV